VATDCKWRFSLILTAFLIDSNGRIPYSATLLYVNLKDQAAYGYKNFWFNQLGPTFLVTRFSCDLKRFELILLEFLSNECLVVPNRLGDRKEGVPK
jgi:hypothetical protein